MNNQCTDRDLLALEPSVFLAGAFASQQLIAGNSAGLSGGLLTRNGVDFAAAGLQAGMVVCLFTGAPTEGRLYEILAVPAPQTLSISVLRSQHDGPAIIPSDAPAISFCVQTFLPQIQAVQQTLQEKMRQLEEVAGIASAAFADSALLRQAVALGVLADLYTAAAAGGANDANWTKAQDYRRRHAQAVSSLRLAQDVDGDGLAERTRALGNVGLRRV